MRESVQIKRVMWLFNHTTLRKFEIPQLQRLGVTEIFLPKNFPYNEGNLSASVTFEYDKSLTISQGELDILNHQEWYNEASSAAWEIVNRHFDTIFVAFFPEQIKSVLDNFKGTVILRPFGLAGTESYSNLFRQLGGVSLQKRIMDAGRRFWFGIGYSHLANIEEPYLADRTVYLPVGLENVEISNKWQGESKHILFVCPRIGSSAYFNDIYRSFKQTFEGLPYKIGGAQPICVNDPNVLGFLSTEDYADIMQQSRVMFYHSQEPDHIHYHPFEAIRAGMPLVFMAGGMLDSLGGKKLPGRCKSTAEARSKIRKLLNGNRRLMQSIKESQGVLLEKMAPDYCAQFWDSGLTKIVETQNAYMSGRPASPVRKVKIALILPAKYMGGTLRGAMALVKAFYEGSRICGDDAEIIFAHIDDPEFYCEEDFVEVAGIASLRAYKWETISQDKAKTAMYFAGFTGWEPDKSSYLVLNDGIDYMMDCDHWLFVSDRLEYPLLPIKPYTVMVYDYIQRYVNFLSNDENDAFLSFARSAEKVWVTTKFTYENACEYAGISKSKLVHMPMLAPDFPIMQNQLEKQSYFLWTTNTSLRKNHINSAKALRIYYEELDGQLECKVSGYGTNAFNEESDIKHIIKVIEIISHSQKMKRAIKFLGNLHDAQYRKTLSAASFLWAPATIDNGTFSVLEAASSGVPSLSSGYPSMHEIDQQFSLNLIFHDSKSPEDMAKQLKYMEKNAMSLRRKLPSPKQLREQNISSHGEHYWNELRSCL